MTQRGWILFAAMAVIWGIPYLLIKIAVAELTPATLVLLRTSLGAAILAPLALTRGDIRPLLRHWKPMLGYTFVEVAGPWILLADAERRLSSSLAGLLIAGVPLVGALLAGWSAAAIGRTRGAWPGSSSASSASGSSWASTSRQTTLSRSERSRSSWSATRSVP